MSKPSRPVPMADALEAWIDRSGLRKKIELASVVDAWPEAVGPQIAP